MILSGAIGFDMLSTWWLIGSGYREITGLIKMFLDAHPITLTIWVALWFCLIYFGDPLFKKLKLTTHIETITIYYAFVSILAGIGNFYLYVAVG